MAQVSLATLNRPAAIRLLQAAILVELSRRPTGGMYGSEIDTFFDNFGEGLIPLSDRSEVLQRLMDEGEMDVAHEGGTTSFSVRNTIQPESPYHERYGITDNGFAKIHAGRRNKASSIYKYLRLGSEWLQIQMEQIYDVALDSPLDVLPIAPNTELNVGASPAFQRQLLEKLDKLIDAVNANNELRVGDRSKFDEISTALSTLQIELQHGKTQAGKIEKIGFGALSFLAKKFAETIIGILATDLWTSIIGFVQSVM